MKVTELIPRPTLEGYPLADAISKRKEALYEHLKMSILTLALQPGSDLDEAAYLDRFALSRTPLREVFRQLAGEGYLDVRKNRGVRVSEMSHTSLREFFLAAPMIYGAILRLAATNATPDQIDRLKAAQTKFSAVLRSGRAADRALANNGFHEITGEMADNTYLLPSFSRLLIDHARIGMTFYQPQTNKMTQNLATANAQHDAIIAAIEARDSDETARLAEEHWRLSRDQIAQFVMPTALEIPLAEFPEATA